MQGKGISGVQQHKQLTQTDKKYESMECENKATTKSVLIQHQALVHEVEKHPQREC